MEEEEIEEAIAEGVALPLKTHTDEDTKSTKEEEATAATGTEVALQSQRKIENTDLAIETKRGRKNTEEAFLLILEDDGSGINLKLIES